MSRDHTANTQLEIPTVDRGDIHDYQPEYLFIPFGINSPRQIRKHTRPYLPDGVEMIIAAIERVVLMAAHSAASKNDVEGP